MEQERYKSYIPPSAAHIEWSDAQLFDEVYFLTTHRLEINPVGERDIQLKRRMAAATFEQMARYSETHDA